MIEDTIVAYATPPGVSGVALLRLSGSRSLEIAKQIFTPGALPQTVKEGDKPFGKAVDALDGYQATLGYVHMPDETVPIDQAIILRFKAPNSYTGEDVFEISLHGGSAVRRSLLTACLKAGARLAEPGEFTRRAFVNGKIDLAQSEAVMDLIEADAGVAGEAAMRQLQGGLSRQIQEYIDLLYSWLSTIEVGMEYPEYEDSSFQNEVLMELLPDLDERLERLENSFTQGRILKEGLQVVFAGRPNAGKSSLMNYLSGEDRSIVTHIAGTTRDTVDIEVQIAGLPVRLIDTAGLRVSDDPVERIGIERAERAMGDADVVFWLLDGDQASGDDLDSLLDLISADELTGIMEASMRSTVYVVVTKHDIRPWTLDVLEAFEKTLLNQVPTLKGVLTTSSISGDGMDHLRLVIRETYEALGARTSDSALIMSERHRDAIRQARMILTPLAKQANILEPVIVGQQLKACAEALSNITGENVSQHLLNEIFSRFCVGK